MTLGIRITIPGNPVPKARARFGKRVVYSEAKTVAYERSVAKLAKVAMTGTKPLEGPLNVTVTAYVKRPKKPKDRQPIVRPDLDNYIKAVLDGCNKIVYLDDAQIVHIVAHKEYSDNPMLAIYVVPA